MIGRSRLDPASDVVSAVSADIRNRLSARPRAGPPGGAGTALTPGCRVRPGRLGRMNTEAARDGVHYTSSVQGGRGSNVPRRKAPSRFAMFDTL